MIIVSPDANDQLFANRMPIDGLRIFAMDVRDLDIDMIDSINPFDASSKRAGVHTILA